MSDGAIICGECDECRARIRAKLRGGTPRRRACANPTAAALEKHAKRFGPEGVAETAAELGVSVDVGKKPRRRRAKGPTLKERVAGYIEAGHSIEVIAELEDLTPGRARRLVEELRGR